MPLTKNPITRYRILDSCFTNKQKRYWTIQELIEKLGSYDLVVNKRTLERDFESMRHDERLGYNAPIAYDKTEKAFYYTDRNFTIQKLPLTAEDFEVLTMAAGIIQTYKGIKLVKQFEGVLDKLVRLAGHLEIPGGQKNIIASGESPYNKGLDYFDIMANAIHNKHTLIISYLKDDYHPEGIHIMYPYFMKEYQARWFVVGYCEMRRRIVTLALDCITGIDPRKDIMFRENTLIEPTKYFKHTLGVTHGEGPAEKIVLRFSPMHAYFIRENRLHPTQKVLKDDARGLMITLQLVPNAELLELLLRYGSNVEVLKPVSLRKQVALEIENMRWRYANERSN